MFGTTTKIGRTSGLAKDTPTGRPTAICPAVGSKVHSFSRLAGLHHRSPFAGSDNSVYRDQLLLSQSEPRMTLSSRAESAGLGVTSAGVTNHEAMAYTPRGSKPLPARPNTQDQPDVLTFSSGDCGLVKAEVARAALALDSLMEYFIM